MPDVQEFWARDGASGPEWPEVEFIPWVDHLTPTDFDDEGEPTGYRPGKTARYVSRVGGQYIQSAVTVYLDEFMDMEETARVDFIAVQIEVAQASLKDLAESLLKKS